MEYRTFAKTTKTISRLGFGGWQLGNEANWSPMTESEGIQLVQSAIEKGITFFDTAPGYASGKSEMIIGKAIEGQREKIVINSKFGHSAEGVTDFSEETMENAVKASLQRLNTDYLDCLVLHNPNMDILSGKTKHFQVLKELKAKGLIRAYGVSIDTYQEFKTVLEKTDCEVIEILFNIFFQAPISLFSFAKAKKITLIAKVPLDSGWLTGKYDRSSIFSGIRERWSKEDIKIRSEYVEKLKRITSDSDLAKYALGFILSFDAITTVIPGVRNLDQLDQNLKNAEYQIPYSIKQSIIELYNSNIKNKQLPW